MKKSRLKKGFTLVELVVAIAVIAILSAVAFGTYLGITETAKKSASNQEAKMLYNQMFLQCGLEEDIKDETDDSLITFRHNMYGFETNRYNNYSLALFLSESLNKLDISNYNIGAARTTEVLTSAPISESQNTVYYFGTYAGSTSKISIKYFAYKPKTFENKYFTIIDCTNGQIVNEIPDGTSWIGSNVGSPMTIGFIRSNKEEHITYSIYNDNNNKEVLNAEEANSRVNKNSTNRDGQVTSFNYRLGASFDQNPVLFNDNNTDKRTFTPQPYVTGKLTLSIKHSNLDVLNAINVTSKDEYDSSITYDYPTIYGYEENSHFESQKVTGGDIYLKQLENKGINNGALVFENYITVNADSSNDFHQKLNFDIGIDSTISDELYDIFNNTNLGIEIKWEATGTDYHHGYLELKAKSGTTYSGLEHIGLRMVPNIKSTSVEDYWWFAHKIPLYLGESFSAHIYSFTSGKVVNSTGNKWVTTNYNDLHGGNSYQNSLNDYNIYFSETSPDLVVDAPTRTNISVERTRIYINLWENVQIDQDGNPNNRNARIVAQKIDGSGTDIIHLGENTWYSDSKINTCSGYLDRDKYSSFGVVFFQSGIECYSTYGDKWIELAGCKESTLHYQVNWVADVDGKKQVSLSAV